MRLLWLPEVLRRAGLTVHEYDGWRTRGLSSFGPIRGIVCHGTAGSLTSTDAGELRVLAITGSGTATPPIAQLYLSRSGQWWVVASGTCTGVLAGTAGPLKGYSDDAVLQIEAQHSTTEPWTETQYRSYVHGVAALVAYREPGYDVPVDRVVGHYEHQPRQKTDPWFDMDRFRAEVRGVLEGEDMAIDEDAFWALAWRGDAFIYDRPVVIGGPMKGEPNKLHARLNAIDAANTKILAALEALGQTNPDVAAILAGVDARLEAQRARIEADTRDAVADLGEGGATAVRAE